MFLCPAQQPKLNQAGEQIVKGVTFEAIANHLANLAPGHATVPSLSHEGHDKIGYRNMLTPFPVPVL